MAIGFVLIETAPAKEYDIYQSLQKIREIKELNVLFGEYDLIAKVEAEDFNALDKIVKDKIMTLQGILDAKTLSGIQFSKEVIA